MVRILALVAFALLAPAARPLTPCAAPCTTVAP